MDKQADYEKAKAEVWEEYHEHVVCNRYWFDNIFARAYHLGRAHAADHIPDATKKVDRAIIAAMAMQGLLSNTKSIYIDGETAEKSPENVAKIAAMFADALLAELGKE